MRFELDFGENRECIYKQRKFKYRVRIKEVCQSRAGFVIGEVCEDRVRMVLKFGQKSREDFQLFLCGSYLGFYVNQFIVYILILN